jgi:ferrous-iron efflux pump FieF
MANAENVPAVDADNGARLRRWATRASVAVALILVTAKLAAYLASGSVSLLSSLVDSTTDLLASLVTLFGVALAARPADSQHRFGHGKAEPLAALAQGAFIIGSAAFLALEAVNRLLDPAPLNHAPVAVGVMVLSIFLTAGLIAFQRYVVNRTASVAVKADRLHYAGDLAMNAAIIVALLATQITGLTFLDSLCALGVAVWLLRSAGQVAQEALNLLMDRELPEEDRQRILDVVASHSLHKGVHDLRTRTDGASIFVELHLEFDPQTTIGEAHRVTDEIEAGLRRLFPNLEASIHQEPAGLQEERLDVRILRS